MHTDKVDFLAIGANPEDQSPNSIPGLLNQIKSMNSIYGRPINTAYTEGFTANRYIGVPDLFQLT